MEREKEKCHVIPHQRVKNKTETRRQRRQIKKITHINIKFNIKNYQNGNIHFNLNFKRIEMD